jgi:protein gp37
MGDNTAIEWTESSWNPWMGCTKVSPGCDHCYMFTEQRRYGTDPELVRRSKTTFTQPLKWKEPRLIFTCSWSDWFHKRADEWRDEAWDIIRRTPQHTYQILTKRPGRILRHLPADWGEGYPNVWLGTTVENQDAVHRARTLAVVPARVRFISAEPLLGPISFALRPDYSTPVDKGNPLDQIQWLIAGGESGPGARPCEDWWLRSLRMQCRDHNVAFFLKQLGGHPDKRGHEKALLDGERYTEMPV